MAPRALDLLLDGRPHVERGHDRPQPARRGDRLEAGDPGTHDEHLCRRDGARGGHQHREQLLQAVGRQERRLVAGDGALRRQRVHRLRPGDARNRLHGEADDASLREPLDPVRIGQRLEKADQHRPRHERGCLLGAGRPDAHDAVDPIEERAALDDRRSGRRVRVVDVAGRGARALLDRDLEPVGHEPPDRVRDQCDPLLARRALPRNRDLHPRDRPAPVAGATGLGLAAAGTGARGT